METLELTWVEVTFHNVASSYIPGIPVECRYTLLSPSHWNSRDWIGLFKVGWRSLHDYYTFEWSSSPQEDQGVITESSVCFEASHLPAESPMCYQFCYIDSQGTCLGSSSPFTFHEPSSTKELQLLDSVDSNINIVLLMNRASLLESQLAESEKAREHLAQLHQQLHQEVDLLKDHIEELHLARDCAHVVHEDLRREFEILQEEKAKAFSDCLQLKSEQEETAAKILDLETDVRILRETVHEREVALTRAQGSIQELVDERIEWIETLKGNTGAQSTLQDQDEEMTEKIRNAEYQVWTHCKIDREIQKQLLEAEKVRVVNLRLELLNCQATTQEKETELLRVQEELNISQIQLLDIFNKNWELNCELQITQKEKNILQKENEELIDHIHFLEEKHRGEINMETTDDQPSTSGIHFSGSMDTEPPTTSQTWTDMEFSLTQPDSEGSQISVDMSQEPEPLEMQTSQDSATSSQAMSDGMEISIDTDMRSTETTITKVDMMNSPDIPTRDGSYVCPICSQRFSMTYKKELMIQHIDSHFFVGASDPFVFQ